MSLTNYYEVLQISPCADPEIVEAAYRRLARKYHPDVCPEAGAAERMRAINEAYAVLRDARSRAAFDAQLAAIVGAGFSPPKGADLGASEPAPADRPGSAVPRPLMVAALSYLTFSFYALYWIYSSWHDLRHGRDQPAMARVWHTLAVALAVYGVGRFPPTSPPGPDPLYAATLALAAYGFARVHAHFRLLEREAARLGAPPRLAAGSHLLLWVAAVALGQLHRSGLATPELRALSGVLSGVPIAVSLWAGERTRDELASRLGGPGGVPAGRPVEWLALAVGACASLVWVLIPAPGAGSSTTPAAAPASSGGPRLELPGTPYSESRVATDVPGTPLPVGLAVSSRIELSAQPRHVYGVDLEAGRTVRIRVRSEPSRSLTLAVAYPGSSSVATFGGSRRALGATVVGGSEWSREFTSPVTGTHYLSIAPTGGDARYSLELIPTGGRTTAGAVASDIPGTPAALGGTLTSVIDATAKPRDVFAVGLAVGQTVRLGVRGDGGPPKPFSVVLAYPGSRTLATYGAYSQAFNETPAGRGEWTRDFTPAVSGVYYLAIDTTASEVRYVLSLAPTGEVTSAGEVALDIPGSPLALGTSVSSVVDARAKPRDVFALSLEAGQPVRLAVRSDRAKPFTITMANPGSRSLATYGAFSQAFNDLRHAGGEWTRDFTPPASGTYYLAVAAGSTETRYQLTASALDAPASVGPGGS